MKDSELDHWIDSLRKRRLPPCPATLEGNVLRRVRLGRREVEKSFWGWAGSLNLRSGLVVAALGLAMVTTTFLTVVSMTSQANRLQRSLEANKALDLAVFRGTEWVNLNKPPVPHE